MHAERDRDGSRWLLPVALAGILAYGAASNSHYPIHEWLFTRVVGYWVFAAFFSLACLSVGLELVERCAPRTFRPTEIAFVAFPIGVLVFALAVFGVAATGRLNSGFFYVIPGVLTFTGWKRLTEWAGRVATLPAVVRFRPTRLDSLAFAFGAIGLVLVYVPILTPQNIQHDARWYHLPIAAEYAASHGLARFPEGWFLAAYPHLSSLLYAWALLWPMPIVDRLELCAHLEFFVFLFTVASIPALVRRLSPGYRLPASWAAFFLFPGFLVYDSTLSTGADHIAAVWAPGGLLVLLIAMRTHSMRHALLLGALAGGAALTKYSAFCISIPLLVFLAASTVRPIVNRKRALRAASALLVAGATFVVVWAPHWLKNWLFYGDPLYPLLAGILHDHPWNAHVAAYFRQFVDHAVQRPALNVHGVLESLRVALSLGFSVHEYPFHDDVPTFGFLFAATLYCLPFVRARRGMKIAFGLGVSAALVWFWTNHRDRYLQACLPWLVAATASVLAVAYRESGKNGRRAAAALVGTQVVFGAGVFLLPVHIMTPFGHPLVHVMKLVKEGYDKRYAVRFEPYSDWGFADYTALGRRLPRRARVLVHEDRLWLGLDAPVVVDEAAWQGGIEYGRFKTASEVFDALEGYGVTHIITGQSHDGGGDHGLAGDLVFWDFVSGSARFVGKHGKLTLWKMPDARPKPAPVGTALVLVCRGGPPAGYYDLAALARWVPLEALTDDSTLDDAALSRAEYVIAEDECPVSPDPSSLDAFELLSVRRDVRYYRRRR